MPVLVIHAQNQFDWRDVAGSSHWPELPALLVEVFLQPGLDRFAALAAEAFYLVQLTFAHRVFQRFEAIDVQLVMNALSQRSDRKSVV